MALAEFEPSVPASELPQNHALDSTVTGIGLYKGFLTWNAFESVSILQPFQNKAFLI